MAKINGEEVDFIVDDANNTYNLVLVSPEDVQDKIKLLQSYIDTRNNNISMIKDEIAELEKQQADLLVQPSVQPAKVQITN